MRHLPFISALAILIAGCVATGPSASVPESSPVRTALPTPVTTTTATPAATPAVTPAATPIPRPSPTPKIVSGWPKVSRGGVTMTGRTVYEEQSYGAAGDPVIRVRVTGLAPGEVVTLSGTGRYDRALFCGPVPSGCREDTPVVAPPPGQPNCMPPYSEQATERGRPSGAGDRRCRRDGPRHPALRHAGDEGGMPRRRRRTWLVPVVRRVEGQGDRPGARAEACAGRVPLWSLMAPRPSAASRPAHRDRACYRSPILARAQHRDSVPRPTPASAGR